MRRWLNRTLKALEDLVTLLREIRDILRRRARSATLVIHPTHWDEEEWMIFEFLSEKGRRFMPATIQVGATATAVYKEWTGPNGTGDEIAPLAAPSFDSSDVIVATVDGNGLVTGVAAGTATITGTDHNNNLSGSDTVTVEGPPPPPVAQSATLVVTAN